MTNNARRRILKSLPALALAGYLQGGLAAGKEQPNIVFILADDLGHADLGVYGQTDFRTPNLDKLAGQGIRFTQAYANSAVCSATRFALITGRYSTGCAAGWRSRSPAPPTPSACRARIRPCRRC